MLTKRVIPCLDVKDGRVVKGVNFVSLRDAGDPVELARAYDREGADEVVFLDITATSGNMQEVKELWTDCDSDTLLVKVDSPGPACHTGNRTCFFKRVEGGVR